MMDERDRISAAAIQVARSGEGAVVATVTTLMCRVAELERQVERRAALIETESDLHAALASKDSEIARLREVERRARFIVMLREHGRKHEPAWNDLVKALNESGDVVTANG
jgi:hypothetical protein